jgi:hypothetical protein
VFPRQCDGGGLSGIQGSRFLKIRDFIRNHRMVSVMVSLP